MQKLVERFQRLMEERGKAPLLFVAIAGAVFFLPFLGSIGLWDPQETHVAEMAREMAHGHSWTVPARLGPRPPLLMWVLAFGYRFLGNGELAGRLPVALLSLGALLACFYAGTGLLRRRAAMLGTLALLTSPAFFLGARQLTTFVAPILATTLAVGGLARAAWPRDPEANEKSDSMQLLHLGVGLLGLVLGFYASGLALGVAVPLSAVAVALLVAAGSGIGAGAKEASLARIMFSVFALVSIGAVVWAWRRGMPGGAHPGYSPILGGTPRASNHAIEYVSLLKQIGFGAFPWVTLLPLAAARLFTTMGGATSVPVVVPAAVPPAAVPPAADPAGDTPSPTLVAEPATDATPRFSRDDYGRLVCLAWMLCAYLGTTLFQASVGDVGFGAHAAIALLAGSFLDELWDQRALPIFTGLLVVIGAAVIAHDFFMFPEDYVGAHLLDGIKWPAATTQEHVILRYIHLPTALAVIPGLILLSGMTWALLIGIGCVLRPAPASESVGDAATPAHPTNLRGRFLTGVVAVSLVSTLATTYWVIPEVSTQFSYKELFSKFHSLVGTGNSEIGKYHVPGQLSQYGKTTELSSLPEMFQFLAKPARVFVIAAADDLPAIDQYAKSKGAEAQNGPSVNYYVIDDSNAKFLMLSNQVGNEKDLNPLKRFLVRVDQGLPRPPQHEAHADFEGKVELVGYDLPKEIERGHDFTVTLYYKVKQPLPAAYKVFLHFDGAGTRFNGDHVPLEGRFPTNYWVPGFYVIDEHKMTADRAMAPAGTYTIYSGFWLGEQRLKAISGPQDGDQRVRLGTVVVK